MLTAQQAASHTLMLDDIEPILKSVEFQIETATKNGMTGTIAILSKTNLTSDAHSKIVKTLKDSGYWVCWTEAYKNGLHVSWEHLIDKDKKPEVQLVNTGDGHARTLAFGLRWFESILGFFKNL